MSTTENKPPMPSSLTLNEVADLMTQWTGDAWTYRNVLACAQDRQVQISARIKQPIKLVRAAPIEGQQNEIEGPAGCMLPLGAAALRQLVNAGVAEFRGWERPILREPKTWVPEWVLAEGQATPEIDLDVCRVSAAGLSHLQAVYPAYEATPAADQPAPMKRSKLVETYKRQWPTIERDLQDAGENGLARAAKAGDPKKRSGWHAAKAIQWATDKGKFQPYEAPASLETAWMGGRQVNRLR